MVILSDQCAFFSSTFESSETIVFGILSCDCKFNIKKSRTKIRVILFICKLIINLFTNKINLIN